jgi:hypothetical protein
MPFSPFLCLSMCVVIRCVVLRVICYRYFLSGFIFLNNANVAAVKTCPVCCMRALMSCRFLSTLLRLLIFLIGDGDVALDDVGDVARDDAWDDVGVVAFDDVLIPVLVPLWFPSIFVVFPFVACPIARSCPSSSRIRLPFGVCCFGSVCLSRFRCP